jgi:5-methylcytosine-specific restriction protein A
MLTGMAFADLSSRDAVTQAIAECDRLGRETFLTKYGFGKAREYFLVIDGQRYDSKAIVGVAHAYQFPDSGPLHPDDFTGGDATVKAKLEELGFTVEKAVDGERQRNPAWTRDELILALDLYFQCGQRVLDDSDSRVIELSEVLNSLPIHSDRQVGFRNPNGVAMKLANFRRLDPAAPGEGHGLARGNSLEPLIWDEFATNPSRLRALAETIRLGRSAVEAQIAPNPDEIDEETEFPEGRVVFRLHRARERSREAVKRCKELARGDLRCRACGFDFAAVYGPLGEGYIECHHVQPVSELRPGHKTKPKDLALVCANCHRMLHRRRPWLAIDALLQLITRRTGSESESR